MRFTGNDDGDERDFGWVAAWWVLGWVELFVSCALDGLFARV